MVGVREAGIPPPYRAEAAKLIAAASCFHLTDIAYAILSYFAERRLNLHAPQAGQKND
jgi:hypothetical protein